MSGKLPPNVNNPYARHSLKNANTEAADATASRLWIAFRRKKNLPDVPTKEEIADDGAEHAVLELAIFALAQPIPHHFDENLQPTTQSNRCLGGESLATYIGKYLKLLRQVDPDHGDWKGLRSNEFPTWWTELRQSILKRAYENMIKWQHSYEFGAPDIRPLYLDLGAVKGENPLKFCDLKHVIFELVRNANPSNKNIEMAAKIMMTYDSIARGGEIKFQKFTDWSFDYMTYVLDTQWKETKTCDNYAMPRVADKRWWFCFFFVMGAYGMCCNGLYRSEEEIKNGHQHTVFPDLQRYSDNYVTTLVGKAVKKGLQGWEGDKEGDVKGIEDCLSLFSAKSCRIGAVNELALHEMINSFALCSRSGHAIGEGVNALESYLDRLNPFLGLPAAFALHGYKCIRIKRAVYPDIKAVGSPNKDSVERLIDAMFLISIPEFQKNGKLREVVEMFAASLILHYTQLRKDCGPTNQISSTLEKHAEDVKITYAGRPNLPPIEVLKLYCKDIEKKFDEDMKQSELGDEAADPKASTELREIVEIASDVKEIKATERELIDELSVAKQALEFYKQRAIQAEKERDDAMASLHQANAKLALFRANSSPVRVPKKRRIMGEGEGVEAHDDGGLTDDGPTEVVPAAVLPPAAILRNTNKSESFNSRSGDSGFKLGSALKELSDRKLFLRGKRLDSITIPNDLCKNRDKLSHCLTLTDFSGNQSDIDKLSKEYRQTHIDVEGTEIMDVVTRLVNAARDKLFEFEGTTYEIELKNKGANVPETSVLGMGKRVAAYRNTLKTDLALPAKGPSGVVLMERNDYLRAMKEKAAPKQATSLDNFLVRRSSSKSSNDN